MRFSSSLILSFFIAVTPCWAGSGEKPDIVVSPGEGVSIQAAIDRVPQNNNRPFVIYLKAGKYEEKITIPADRPFVHLVGEDRDKTVLTYADYAKKLRSDGKEIGTFASFSVSVKGNDFQAENLTIENSAGPGSKVAQAVALSVESDRAVFRNCRFLGSQDTLLANKGRQYYKNCQIVGGVDFIFGNATAVFDACQVHSNSTGI